MNSEIYFDLEKISIIEMRPETPSNYTFYPEKPAQQRHIFGFIPFGKTPALPARWSTHGEKSYYETDLSMRENPWYRIEDSEKKIYHKAQVKIHLGYKETVNRLFDSTKEAKEWAENIIESSGKKLELLIK